MKLIVFSVLFAITFMSDGDMKSEALPLTNIENFIQDSTAESTVDSGPGVTKIIMVADADLLRMLKALERNMPERILSPEGRDESPDLGARISIIKRDTKRCMVGRVYRPCWEIQFLWRSLQTTARKSRSYPLIMICSTCYLSVF